MSRMEVKRPVTIDDMYHMPKDGQKYELVDGEVVVSPASFYTRNSGKDCPHYRDLSR